MSYKKWIDYLLSAEKLAQVHGDRKRVSYVFPDKSEMMEIYNLHTNVVESRGWRNQKMLTVTSRPDDWQYELGEPLTHKNEEPCVLQESTTSPVLTKRVTKKNIEWRVSNLPYPLEVYKVVADADKNAIVISTTNKKYYKVLMVPELQRCSLKPQQSNISVHHQNNTLVVNYCKPKLVNEMEDIVLNMVKKLPSQFPDLGI